MMVTAGEVRECGGGVVGLVVWCGRGAVGDGCMYIMIARACALHGACQHVYMYGRNNAGITASRNPKKFLCAR